MTAEILEKMLGHCTFEKEEYRAPKNSYTFERFNLLQKVNNLRVDINGEKVDISQDKKEQIVKMAYEKAEIKYTQLRNLLELPIEAKFSGLNYIVSKKNQELSKEDFIKNVEKQKFIKLEGWNKIRLALKDNKEKFEEIRKNPELQNIIADALVRNKTDEKIKEYLNEKGIDEIIVNAVLKLNFTKFGHLSYKAMNKIIPGLEKGLTYDKACNEAGYVFNKDLKHKLPPVSALEDKITNPVVLRAVSEARKVINNLIDKYGSPTAIYIETSRDLSKSYEERTRIDKKQEDNKKRNDKMKEEIKELFGFDAKPFDIVKMKLWKEQGEKCIYSGKSIPANRLFEENFVQVDHIIPFSRCFDDSYQNKVLVLADENQKKKERIPFEYFRKR